MLLQAAIFYLAAVYGGIEESLSQNAADILAERMLNRKNELETQFNNRCFDLDACEFALKESYAEFETEHGAQPLLGDSELQIAYLRKSADTLVETLRQNEVNGVFLIINDSPTPDSLQSGEEKRYGLCIRDMDQESNYTGREDLLLERAPSSIVDSLGCSLDSWWEARYTFQSKEAGDYYFYPLEAAWDNQRAKGADLAYLSSAHRISGKDRPVVSYSIPLIAEDGYPFGVVGVELTTDYLSSRLPYDGINDKSQTFYVLAFKEEDGDVCIPVAGTGTTYSRYFIPESAISCADSASTGGFNVSGRGGVKLYGDLAQMSVYNNNNPFEARQLVLLALAEQDTLFAYIGRIKFALMLASLFCLALGVAGIFLVSRRFSAPITELAGRVRDIQPRSGEKLDRLDITEIDQLVDSIEELHTNVSRNSARTEFFSRMSHDMRTPMNAIISFSSPELLEGASETAKDDYLAKIHSAGDYLLGLINEVLDMTKIENNKIELKPSSVLASRLCDTTIPIIEKLAQAKGVAFASEVACDSDLYVMVDTQYFDQIVINLLSNAVKFTNAGGVVSFKVAIAPKAGEDSALRCRIVVADSGIGMSDDFLKKLYVPFEQENGALEGTGLGLSIVKRLVELMGGEIECESRKDEGTTFTVELPLERGAAAAAEPDARQRVYEHAESGALRGKRILVCEDHAINTQIVCRLLEKLGIETEVAENGKVSVEKFAASAPYRYDAVLMDIRMPVMDGLAATRAIRALARPDAATVPIIAMTANAFEEDVRDSSEAGMNEHLAKPIDTKEFFEVLMRYLAPGEGEDKS